MTSCIGTKAKRPGRKVVCPCCERGLDDPDSVRMFSDQMKTLMGSDSPLLKDGENNKTAKSQYQKWRKIVAENMNDILEYRRIANEVNDMEHNCSSLDTEVEERKKDLETAKMSRDEIQSEVEGLRSLLESCKMWKDAADRINSKRSQAMNKSSTLSISESVHSGRDLKAVERDLAEKTGKRDEYLEKVCFESQPRFGIKMELKLFFFVPIGKSSQQGDDKDKQSDVVGFEAGESRSNLWGVYVEELIILF